MLAGRKRFGVRKSWWIVAGMWLVVAPAATSAEQPLPCQIRVVEKGTDWPVPLVELRTTHHVRFITDNAGTIAFDLPECLGQETWLSVEGHGYSVPADGFGFRGVRVTPQPGETITIEVERSNIARRLGRLTGAGQFAETERCTGNVGERSTLTTRDIVGCDSVQLARYRGQLYWAWGDTSLARYPLGVFETSSATTSLSPIAEFRPPLSITWKHFRDSKGALRGVAKFPGKGPTWLSAYMVLPDASGHERLCASYCKITPPLETNECGLCVWNDEQDGFETAMVLWNKNRDGGQRPVFPDGHPARYRDNQGIEWVLFGNPFPTLKCPARFEDWKDPSLWQQVPAVASVQGVSGAKVLPHSGSITYMPARKNWVAIFVEKFGNPSPFGEVWYAEAASPFGPWGKATKIVSHNNYTFYNPRIQHELLPSESRFLVFEGTYTREFANHAIPTPRYDYNQILYRLDLDDPALQESWASAVTP